MVRAIKVSNMELERFIDGIKELIPSYISTIKHNYNANADEVTKLLRKINKSILSIRPGAERLERKFPEYSPILKDIIASCENIVILVEKWFNEPFNRYIVLNQVESQLILIQKYIKELSVEPEFSKD